MYHLILFPHTERPQASSPVKRTVSISFSQSCPAKTINPFSSSPSRVSAKVCFPSEKFQLSAPSSRMPPSLKETGRDRFHSSFSSSPSPHNICPASNLRSYSGSCTRKISHSPTKSTSENFRGLLPVYHSGDTTGHPSSVKNICRTCKSIIRLCGDKRL